jgi:short chain dehydrogenase
VRRAHERFGRLDVVVNNGGYGHFGVSSVNGISAFMNTGAYHASKWALEGLSQSLSLEVARFGVKGTLVEPAGYSTDWSGSSARHSTPLPIYDQARDEAVRAREQRVPVPGNPVATREVILQLVDSENPPLRRSHAAAPAARRPSTPHAGPAPSGSRAGNARAGRRPRRSPSDDLQPGGPPRRDE